MFEIGDLVKVKDKYIGTYKEYKGKKRKVIRKSVASEGPGKVTKYLYALDDRGIKDSIPFFEYEIELVQAVENPVETIVKKEHGESIIIPASEATSKKSKKKAV